MSLYRLVPVVSLLAGVLADVLAGGPGRAARDARSG